MLLSVTRRILPVFLCLMLCLTWLPSGAFAEEVPASEPEETISPTETAPSESTEESTPEESLPPETVPETSLPSETIPEEPSSEETVPAEPSFPEESTDTESTVTEPSSEETVPTEPLCEDAALTALSPEPPGPGLYFGLLHGHSSFSEGTATAEEAFSLARQSGLHFLALTDHGDSLTADDWAAGKAAAAASTSHDFAALYGYEMNWPARMQIGHIGTFSTDGFVSWQEGFDAFDGALERYYAAMAATGAIGQFCHPGTQYGNFCDFDHHSPAADSFMQLLETDGNSEQYIKALDAGWHVGPVWQADSHGGRTAVSAESLTEEGIYDALRRHRVYATADPDLSISYTLEGFEMGSTVEERHLGETADLSATLSDPTDASIGLVEVVTSGGEVLGSQAISASSGSICFSFAAEHPYYFLRVTQPDGDIALTAPIWVSLTEDVGILSLTCDTAVPVQGEDTMLTLKLYNHENTDFQVDALEVLADETVIFADDTLSLLPADSDLTHSISAMFDCLGQTTVTVRLTGTLEGEPRTYEAALTLSFRQSALVTDILVDGSHGNAGTDRLIELTALAAKQDIRVTVADEITAEALEKARFLVVPAPREPLSEYFLDLVSQYVAFGGSVILCGQTDSRDGEVHSAFQLNRLLSALGCSMRLRDDEVRDANGSALLYPDVFNADSPWCSGLSSNQTYRLENGCSVEPGGGQWLVNGSGLHAIDGDSDGLGGQEAGALTVLACEELISGASIFAAGSLFLCDENILPPEQAWKEPYANRSILENLLGIGGEALPLRTVSQARAGEPGELFRIRGYVTAGTANPHNTFPGTLYLQDDTGGIAVVPFTETGIRVGTPIEIVGHADVQNGNRILKTISFEVLDAALYQYQPKTGIWSKLLDMENYGGMLVEIEGECTGVLCREDGTVSGVLLKNEAGQTARVLIEDMIFSGATGENTLHLDIRKGRTVRAMGILYQTESGETVLRVRNCEEVVYVPPLTYINPKTGDALSVYIMAMTLSALALLLLKRKTV